MIRLESADYDKHWADLFVWRNDPLTQRMSLTQELISVETHLAWLDKTLKDDRVSIYIARDESFGVKVGMCRLDREKGKQPRIEVSLIVSPEQRGKGYALRILQAMLNLRDVFGDKKPVLVAHIREENGPSLRAFVSCGFKFAKVQSGVIELTRQT